MRFKKRIEWIFFSAGECKIQIVKCIQFLYIVSAITVLAKFRNLSSIISFDCSVGCRVRYKLKSNWEPFCPN